MQFKISTTGTQDPIVFHDLGARSFSHPTVDYDLSSEFKLSEISESYDVQNCIDLGYITAKDENDNPVIDVESIGLHQHGNKSELDKITIGDHDVTSTGNPHNVKATDISDFDTEVTNNSTVADHESRISGLEGAGLGISWFNFLIAVTPSSPLHIMGNGANGFNPGYDIRLLELRVQFLSEHNSQSALRVRVFKYDAVAAVSREVLSASANGVSQGYATLNDLTPDTDHYNLDSSEGDTVYLIIDRSNGSSPNRVSEISINVKYQPIG